VNVRWLLLLTFAPAVSSGDEGAKQRDLAALQGQWQVRWLERDGKRFETDRGAIFTIQGDKFLFGKSERIGLKIDPSYRPKLLDVTFLSEDDAARGQTSEGIYMIDGDVLVWCYYTKGGPKQRPLQFRTEKGSGLYMTGFKRVKQDGK
jgi:uncharacterized protein (TIGR03067 family)